MALINWHADNFRAINLSIYISSFHSLKWQLSLFCSVHEPFSFPFHSQNSGKKRKVLLQTMTSSTDRIFEVLWQSDFNELSLVGVMCEVSKIL